jgi:hypothetical protein
VRPFFSSYLDQAIPADTDATNAANRFGSPPIAWNPPTTKFFSRSHDAVIRVYDEAGNMIETHEHAGDFREW